MTPQDRRPFILCVLVLTGTVASLSRAQDMPEVLVTSGLSAGAHRCYAC